jgi:hypothetical protein
MTASRTKEAGVRNRTDQGLTPPPVPVIGCET